MLALMLPTQTASARTAKKTKPNVVTNAYWEVSSVDATSNTVELQKSNNTSNLTLKVSTATKITLDGKPAKLADLQKGVKVNFNSLGDQCSRLEAEAVSSKPTKKK